MHASVEVYCIESSDFKLHMLPLNDSYESSFRGRISSSIIDLNYLIIRGIKYKYNTSQLLIYNGVII